MSTAVVLGLASAVGLLVASESPCPTDDPCAPLSGRLRRAGERQPLENVAVLVVPSPEGARAGRVDASVPVDPTWMVRAVTDAQGRFVAPAVPRTHVRIVIVREGYERHDQVVDANEQRPLRLFLRPDADAEYRTIVEARDDAPPSANVSAHRLEREELRTIPGSQSDALRGAQALPGFARPPFGLGLLVLRGAPPTQSTVMLGEHPVRRAFHALPVAAIVPSDAIEALEIVPSNYSARYGPGSGGLVRIAPRHGRRDGHHGHVEADLIAAGAAQEGPLGRGSYLVGGRNAHIGHVLGVLEKVEGVNTFPRPTFWDYQTALGGAVARGLTIHAAVHGAGDRAEQRTPVSGGSRSLLTYRGQMHRPSLDVVGQVDRVRVLASVALLASNDSFEVPDARKTERLDVQPSYRFEVTTAIHPSARFSIGTDGVVVRRRTEVRETQLQGYDDGQPVLEVDRTSDTGIDTNLALYAIVDLRRGPVRVVPGTRLQTFTSGDAFTIAMDPRVSLEIQPVERVRLRAGAGIYSQPSLAVRSQSSQFIDEALGVLAPRVILPPSLVESFEPQVPSEQVSRIALRRALHVSGGPEVDLPLDTTLGATVFGRMYRAGGIIEPDPIAGSLARIFEHPQEGHEVGAELLVRKHLSRKLYGWIAYTLMKSVVGRAPARVPGDFDQRHNLSIVASYGLPRGVRFGARFRLASGAPYTPVAAVGGVPITYFDGTIRVERVLLGPKNSARMPFFHQLDLRLDKQWILSRASIGCYVDVQNVYNRENTDLYIYDWDFTRPVRSLGLPIFPSLGVRVDW